MNDIIPKAIILAQEFQKAGDYENSIKLYNEFFHSHENHPLRIKALFEIADNYYHNKDYQSAKEQYRYFVEYCGSQEFECDKEYELCKAYVDLSNSRLCSIAEIMNSEKT